MRGGGKPAVPMFVMLAFWCVLRVSILWALAPLHDILWVYLVYPITWAASSLFFLWYYHQKTWLYDNNIAAASMPEEDGDCDYTSVPLQPAAEACSSEGCCAAGCVRNAACHKD